VTTPAELKALRDALATEADLERRDRRTKLGLYGSAYNDLASAEAHAIVPKEGTPRWESIAWMTALLRGHFSQHKYLTYVGGPDGHTDMHNSKIIITSTLAPMDVEDSLELPKILVDAGPSASRELGIGNRLHFDMRRGTETLTGMSPGVIMLNLRAKTSADMAALVDHVDLYIKTGRDEICRQRWVDIGTPTVNFDNNAVNQRFAPGTKSQEERYAQILFAYHYQWVAVRKPRPDAAVEYNTAIVGVTDEDPVRYIDGRTNPDLNGSEDFELVYVLPSDPSEE
jgi:hypothetical protein